MITENLQIIKDSTIAIKNAIIEKGGIIEGDISTWSNSIKNLPSSGYSGSSSSKGDVTFYDYDGTILHSYTKNEFLVLTKLPSLPSQSGLMCQGWNYELNNAKEFVEEYGKLDIGATYITDDGKTRLYIRIAAEGRMTVPLYFSQTVANGVIIDWGDGSATQTLSGTGNKNTSHTYASIGDYCITLTVSGCTLGLGHNSTSYCVLGSTGNNGKVYCNMLQKVEIGNGVTSIGTYTFYGCYSLASVTIPDSVTSIGNNVFPNCTSLAFVTIPDSVTSIGNNVFQSCTSLAFVTIPDSVTSIGNSAFYGCYSLSSIAIPNGMTSIGNQMFYNCYSLSSVTIPGSVTSIIQSAFNNCYGMACYDFSSHTAVPTLGNTNAFTGIPSDCKIIVPDVLYDEWIAATNWSAYATYTIKKSDWDNLKQGGSL